MGPAYRFCFSRLDTSASRTSRMASRTLVWIARVRHGLGLMIVPIVDHGIVATEFLQQRDDLGLLVIAQECELHHQLLAPSGQHLGAVLARENDDGHERRREGEKQLEPFERRRIEGRHAEDPGPD